MLLVNYLTNKIRAFEIKLFRAKLWGELRVMQQLAFGLSKQSVGAGCRLKAGRPLFGSRGRCNEVQPAGWLASQSSPGCNSCTSGWL